MTQRQAKAATIRMATHPVQLEEVIANGIAGVSCPPGMTYRRVLPSGAIPDLLRMLTDLTQGRKVG
jgi:hypothetical protein